MGLEGGNFEVSVNINLHIGNIINSNKLLIVFQVELFQVYVGPGSLIGWPGATNPYS